MGRMTTLADLRNKLRTLLNDGGAPGQLWSDATLNLYLDGAVRSYGRLLPREMETTVVTVAGQGAYGLPEDCVRLVRVAFDGESPGCPGVDYELYGGKLVLSPTPTESGLIVAVRYLAAHALLLSDADISTVPDPDEGLVLALAAARVVGSLALDEAKRGRFESRSGQSALTAAGLFRKDYEAGLRDRLSSVGMTRLTVR